MPYVDKETDRAYRRVYDLNRYHVRRKAALDFLGGSCVKCGSTENLEIDHINRSTKSFTTSSMWGIAKNKFWQELEKCQILCKYCHKIKSDIEQITRTHGTYSMYRRGKCRCFECVTIYRQKSREWNESFRKRSKNK